MLVISVNKTKEDLSRPPFPSVYQGEVLKRQLTFSLAFPICSILLLVTLCLFFLFSAPISSSFPSPLFFLLAPTSFLKPLLFLSALSFVFPPPLAASRDVNEVIFFLPLLTNRLAMRNGQFESRWLTQSAHQPTGHRCLSVMVSTSFLY